MPACWIKYKMRLFIYFSIRQMRKKERQGILIGMDRDYWLKQQPDTPLFPNIEWQKPEQRSLAGKLLIIGGNAHGFAAVAQAYQDARAAGAGEVRVALPDALKKTIDPLALDCVYVPTNASGGITKEG